MSKEKIQRLRQKIEAYQRNNPGQLVLNPPIPLEHVRSIEAHARVKLPMEYVEFVTQIGDGGKVPNRNMEECDQLYSLGQREVEEYAQFDWDRPFTLKESWISTEDSLTEDDSELSEEELELAYEAQCDMLSGDGHISLMSEYIEAVNAVILIVTGPRCGEVWLYNQYDAEFNLLRLKNCTFLDWFEMCLDGTLDDFVERQKKAEQLTPLEQCEKLVKHHRVKMNPPLSLEQVREFERRHGVTFPEEYVEFVTKIGNGSRRAPWYINHIFSMEEYEALEHMAEPFFVQTEEDLRKLFPNDKRPIRYRSISESEWDGILPPLQDHALQEKFWDIPDFQQVEKGCIPIFKYKKMYAPYIDIKNKISAPPVIDVKKVYILILNGISRGQVWILRKNYRDPPPHRYSITAPSCFTMLNMLDGSDGMF